MYFYFLESSKSSTFENTVIRVAVNDVEQVFVSDPAELFERTEIRPAELQRTLRLAA